jgi:hypothetical protein
MSFLGAFNTQLIRFFEGLAEIFPEERDIKLAIEAIQGLKRRPLERSLEKKV